MDSQKKVLKMLKGLAIPIASVRQMSKVWHVPMASVRQMSCHVMLKLPLGKVRHSRITIKHFGTGMKRSVTRTV